MMTPTYTNVELALKNMTGEEGDLSCRIINTSWDIIIYFTIIPLYVGEYVILHAYLTYFQYSVGDRTFLQ